MLTLVNLFQGKLEFTFFFKKIFIINCDFVYKAIPLSIPDKNTDFSYL